MLRWTVDNPFTGAVACDIELADATAIDVTLERARAAFLALSSSSLEERTQWLAGATRWMLEQGESLATDISRMMGKPKSQALGELRTMADRSRVVSEMAVEALADHPCGPEDGVRRRVRRRPLGVVVDLPAWNYPLATAINVIAPAVLAGNAVVVKHAPRSPLCAEHFAKAFAVAGAPPHLVQALHIDHAATARLVADARVDQVVFTGSVRGGHAISTALAGRCMQPTYELGGNDGAYVAADADLTRSVEALVDGGIYNAGQSCCGVERIFVHADLYDRFVEAARELVGGYVLGDPLEEETTLGPMAQPDHPAELEGMVRDAVRGGARLVAGGHPCKADGRGRFFEPTLLEGMRPSMRLMREESFGPILAVQKVASDEEALGCLVDSRYGLTASVWTADEARAERFAAKVSVGTLFMNRADYVDPWLPWSGVGDSGRGQTLGAAGFDTVTRPFALHFRS